MGTKTVQLPFDKTNTTILQLDVIDSDLFDTSSLALAETIGTSSPDRVRPHMETQQGTSENSEIQPETLVHEDTPNAEIDQGMMIPRASTLLSPDRPVNTTQNFSTEFPGLAALSLTPDSVPNPLDIYNDNRARGDLEQSAPTINEFNSVSTRSIANDNPDQVIPPNTDTPADSTEPTDAPRELVGGWGDDVLTGGSGNDRLLGNGGNDILDAQNGDDYVFGAAGNDVINGGRGDDELRGGLGNDDIQGGAGNDYLNGWSGDDLLNGGDGNDHLEGGSGNDTYTISDDALGDQDVIYDSSGHDILNFDTFNPFENISTVHQLGNDLVFSYRDGGELTLQDFYGAGRIEVIQFNGSQYATNADVSSPLSFSDFVTGTQDMILVGTDADDTLDGGIGNDRLEGGHGADALSGSAGNDEIYGGSGNDLLYGGEGDDRLLGQTGNDIGDGGAGNDYLFGDIGNDTLSGGDGDDEVRGGSGHDVLSGNDGNDFLHGYFGNDWLNGGAGDDRLEGGSGRDTFEIRRGGGHDTIVDFTLFSTGAFATDKIDLRDFGLASFDDLVMSELLNDTLIDLGNGDQITLENIRISDLSSDDFSF